VARIFSVIGHYPLILLLEPNVNLRRAVHELLVGEGYQVADCGSLEEVMQSANGPASAVALVAWQSMDGLLADAHRHQLADVTRRVRLVLMVPRRWQRLLNGSTLGFAGLVPKPFSADELLDQLSQLQSVGASQAAAGSD
jgi:CheY-like chemotaxis protein